MAQDAHMKEYLYFMQWFKGKYPGLYAECWKNIEISNDNTVLRINHNNSIDAATRSRLEETEKEYHDTKR